MRFPDGREHEDGDRAPPAVGRAAADARRWPDRDLIRQYRPASTRASGSCRRAASNAGESAEAAAARECEEEIGLAPAPASSGCEAVSAPGFCDEEMIFFRVSGLRRTAARLAAQARRGRRHRRRSVHGRRGEGDGRARRDRRSEDGVRGSRSDQSLSKPRATLLRSSRTWIADRVLHVGARSRRRARSTSGTPAAARPR